MSAALLTLAASGCRRAEAPAAAATPAPVTFDKDIAPIVFTNCATCHRPGEVGPFPLLSYADVKKHAQSVSEQTLERHMPPWLPAPGEFPIQGERRLTARQIDAIQRWIKEGRPEGNPADLPPAPVFPNGWQLGQPDVVLAPPKPYILKPGIEDVYRNLVLRTSLTHPVYVRAVELRTNGAPIHHAVIRVDSTGESEARDGLDGQPGFEGMSWQSVQDPGGQFLGWAPGRGPIVSPPDMAWRLDPGADLVVELHMLRPKTPHEIRPTIGLYLTNTPPTHTPVTVLLSSKTIDIPACDPAYVVTESADLPVAVQLLSVYPHAHYLCRDMLVTAAFPDSTVKTLLHIPNWSFHWQQDYRYATPIALPAGTTITMKYTYDNSDRNQRNPHHPPVRVRLGPNSTDEMGELGLEVLPASLADAAQLVQAFDERDAQADVTLAEMRVREAPENADNQAFLGESYVDVERYEDAKPHLEAAIRLNPKSASARSNLGTVLLEEGNVAASIAQLQQASVLRPRDQSIWFNLGNALKAASRFDEAAAAYQRTLAIDPNDADAHVNLGVLLFSRGRYSDALPHFQRAVDLRPKSAVIRTDLGNALAATGRYADATREIRQALRINPDYAPAQETLGKLTRLGGR
ncbi:MAG: tetratricopeptide repeat protein [Vicinamibacterales bacterium]